MGPQSLNPIQLALMLKKGNPQQVAEQIIQTNYPNDPNMKQLLDLGRKGDVQSLEQIASQVLGSQGKDFAVEMQNLMNTIKHL